MTTIRRLGPDDLGAMDAMLDLFAAAFEDPEHYSAARPDAGYQRRLLGDPTFVALAAFGADGTMTGGLAAYELRKFEQARSELYIYDLAVAEAHRRRGIATALIEALVAHGRTCSAWTVYVQADHGDDPAIALYTKLGEREDVMHFDIAVTPQG